MADLPRWSAIRGLPFDAQVAAAVEKAASGDTSALPEVLKLCAKHERRQ